MMPDIPEAKFLPAKYVTRDDETSYDPDLSAMASEVYRCLFTDWLISR